MTIVYGFERGIWGIWNIIRGNHARQPRCSSPKQREFALFVLKVKRLFQVYSNVYFFNPSIFWHNKGFIYPPLGGFGEIVPSVMIYTSSWSRSTVVLVIKFERAGVEGHKDTYPRLHSLCSLPPPPLPSHRFYSQKAFQNAEL